MNKDMLVKMKHQGFNGNETEKDLLFYLIDKIDRFESTNNEAHSAINKQHKLNNVCTVKNTKDIYYQRLGIYGLGVMVIFILGIMFL